MQIRWKRCRCFVPGLLLKYRPAPFLEPVLMLVLSFVHTLLLAALHRRSIQVILIPNRCCLQVIFPAMKDCNKQGFWQISDICFRKFLHLFSIAIFFNPFFTLLVNSGIHKKSKHDWCRTVNGHATEVLGSQRSKPLYNFFASSTVAMLTPLLPILP